MIRYIISRCRPVAFGLQNGVYILIIGVTHRHGRTDGRRMVFQRGAYERRRRRRVQTSGGPGRAVAVDGERVGVGRRRLTAVVLHLLHVVLQVIRFQGLAQGQFFRVSDICR